MEANVQRTWKPITAGILNIITGAISAFTVFGLIIAIAAFDILYFLEDVIPPGDLPLVAPLVNTILILLLVLSIIHTIFPILGGVFALQRRRWGWALSGAIIAIFAVFPLGVASTIFVALAKEEFE